MNPFRTPADPPPKEPKEKPMKKPMKEELRKAAVMIRFAYVLIPLGALIALGAAVFSDLAQGMRNTATALSLIGGGTLFVGAFLFFIGSVERSVHKESKPYE
jgi:hypothetical protein